MKTIVTALVTMIMTGIGFMTDYSMISGIILGFFVGIMIHVEHRRNRNE